MRILPDSIRDNIDFVLVNTLYSGNIGSSARAVKNMGFKNLVIVNPKCDIYDIECKKMAVFAYDIVEGARVYNSIEEIQSKYDIIISTTARSGKWRKICYNIREIDSFLGDIAFNNKVAIMFGSEDSGLSNDEIQISHLSITIPTSRHSSLNLSQAVLIVAYELFNHYSSGMEFSVGTNDRIANIQRIKELSRFIRDVLVDIEFFDRGDPDRIENLFKIILSRARTTNTEAKAIEGIFRRIGVISKR